MSEDADLEALIDKAGRQAVFSRARAYGWTGDAPKWVWRDIANEVLEGAPPPFDARPMHEQVLGFRLW